MTPVTMGSRDSQRLYEITLDGACETSGNVEAPSNWFALVPDSGYWYLVIQDSLGFNHAYQYETEEEARSHYAELEDEYSAWMDDEPSGEEEYDTSDPYDIEYDVP